MADNKFAYPSLVTKSNNPYTTIERNVFYSTDYPPNNSYEELFNFDKQNNAQKPMRKRNLPDSFFTPPSASSSASHSRESSLDANNNCSPKQSSTSASSHHANSNFENEESSSMKIDSKQSSTNHNVVLGQVHIKTRSLPASFAPDKTQLEPFSQLKQNLLYQNKLRAINNGNVSVDSAEGPPTQIINSNNTFQGQVFSTVHQIQSNMFQQTTLLDQTWMPLQLNQQVNVLPNNHQLSSICAQNNVNMQNYVSPTVYQTQPYVYLHNTVQQLEKERENMRKRQIELQQINLIGTNRVQTQNPPTPTQYRSLTSLYHLNDNQSSTHSRCNTMLPNHAIKQESLDSGLDLTCYSSSTDSTNQMIHENFIYPGNSDANRTNCNNTGNISKYSNRTSNHKTPSVVETRAAKSVFEPNYTDTIKSHMSTVEKHVESSNENIKHSTIEMNDSSRHASTCKWKIKIESPSTTPVNDTDYLHYNNNTLFDIYDSMSIESNIGIENFLSANEINANQMTEESFASFHELDLLGPISNFNLSDHLDQSGLNFSTF